jgi:hypothetical protein
MRRIHFIANRCCVLVVAKPIMREQDLTRTATTFTKHLENKVIHLAGITINYFQIINLL